MVPWDEIAEHTVNKMTWQWVTEKLAVKSYLKCVGGEAKERVRIVEVWSGVMR